MVNPISYPEDFVKGLSPAQRAELMAAMSKGIPDLPFAKAAGGTAEYRALQDADGATVFAPSAAVLTAADIAAKGGRVSVSVDF